MTTMPQVRASNSARAPTNRLAYQPPSTPAAGQSAVTSPYAAGPAPMSSRTKNTSATLTMTVAKIAAPRPSTATSSTRSRRTRSKPTHSPASTWCGSGTRWVRKKSTAAAITTYVAPSRSRAVRTEVASTSPPAIAKPTRKPACWIVEYQP